MSKYGILQVDGEYEFTVRDIREAASTFKSKKQGTSGMTMYCHHFVLADEDKVEYLCQICDVKNTQNFCNVQDTMGFKVKAFTFDIHTIEFITRDGKPVNTSTELPEKSNEQIMKEFQQQPMEFVKTEMFLSSDHLRIAALHGACMYFQNRVEDTVTGNVLEKAEEFYQWLKS